MMNRTFISLLLFLSLSALAAVSNAQATPKFMIVVLENEDATDALSQPFLKNLANSGAYLNNLVALARPSQPNYIGLISGSTYNVKTNGNVDLDASHIGDQLERAGKTWRVYAEDYPGTDRNCFTGGSYKGYARKHNPFMSFKNVSTQPARCAKIIGMNSIIADLSTGNIADVSLVIPNNMNSGHDSGIQYADRWLANTFGPFVQNNSFPDDLVFIVTFDEAGKFSRNNQVYGALFGKRVNPGILNAPYSLYSILRTIQDQLGLGTLGKEDQKALPIQGFIK